MTEYDEYVGGKDWILGLWPYEKLTKNDHAHLHAKGGYYNHRHDKGDVVHTHESDGQR